MSALSIRLYYHLYDQNTVRFLPECHWQDLRLVAPSAAALPPAAPARRDPRAADQRGRDCGRRKNWEVLRTQLRGQCYKTFYGRKLRLFKIS